MTKSDYEQRTIRDALHDANREIEIYKSILQSACDETIARGGSETFFARLCGLDLADLHDLIGMHAERRQEHHVF